MERGLQAIIFECDGVLVDTAAATKRAWRSLSDEWLRAEPPSDEALLALVGRRPGDALPGFLREWFAHREVDEAVRARAEHYYRAVREDGLEGFPQTGHVLQHLRERGLAYGCVSANPLDQLLFELQQADLLDAVPLCVGGDEVDAGPPAPDLLCEAAHRLGADPSACLFVGATPVGVQGAHAARMAVVAIATLWGAGDLADAHALLRSMSELPSVLDRID